jgi:putative acetyltransferase
MRIRIATSLDRDDIHNVHLCAFPESERDIVSKLAINLLFEKTIPQTISLVAETEGSVIGHVAFSPVTIDDNENLQGYILAPLGVKPDYQKRCIGSKLVESGMQQLLNMGVNILFVYGDPEYYNRFGFSVDTANQYTPPYKLQYPFGWQAIELNECNHTKSSIKIACVTSLCDPELW